MQFSKQGEGREAKNILDEGVESRNIQFQQFTETNEYSDSPNGESKLLLRSLRTN
jgi:hypothetical protein